MSPNISFLPIEDFKRLMERAAANASVIVPSLPHTRTTPEMEAEQMKDPMFHSRLKAWNEAFANEGERLIDEFRSTGAEPI